MNKLRSRLASLRRDFDYIQNVDSERTPETVATLQTIHMEVIEVRNNLQEAKERQMKLLCDSWDTDIKRQILEKGQRDIQSDLKCEYRQNSQQMHLALEEKSKELNERLQAMIEKHKERYEAHLQSLVDDLMATWKACAAPITPPVAAVELASTNLLQALFKVMNTRVRAEFKAWEAEQNTIVASVHRIDEAMVLQEEVIRQKFQAWLEGDISARFADKQAHLDALEDKLRMTEQQFYRSMEVRAEEITIQEGTMRKKYEALLAEHDQQRSQWRTENVRQSSLELADTLKSVLADAMEKHAIYEEGVREAQSVLEKLQGGPISVPDSIKAKRIIHGSEAPSVAEWSQWSIEPWKRRMEGKMKVLGESIPLEGENKEDPMPEETRGEKFLHMNYVDVFRSLHKLRTKALAQLHKTIDQREEELEGFYLPSIAKLSLRATETCRALHYESKLQKESPPVSPQTYGQVLECLSNTWDFLNVPENVRSEFIQRSLARSR